MTGSAMRWRNPSSGVPPWLAALLTVGGILLVINALPMLASAITPDRATLLPTAVAPPSPIPLGGPLPVAPHGAARADGGEESAGSNRSDPAAQVQTPRKPLPVAGGNALPPLALGGVLLVGGVGLLMMVGFTGERPWPGRYVRRIG